MNAEVRPYARAQDYRARGWSGTLPLPPNSKTPPPAGYTGDEGAWPTDADVDRWVGEMPDANLALRLPPAIVGLDVDHYDDKAGLDELATLESAYGRLPPTWMSTSRENGSGIRLFRVPPGLSWPSVAAASIEIIRHGHRYVIAAPSIHPKGRAYRWIGPDGSEANGEIPGLGDLPELPMAWLTALTGYGSNGNGKTPSEIGTRARRRDVVRRAHAWLEGLPSGDPCSYVGRLSADLMAAARREDGNAHDHTLAQVMALLRAGETGHTGVLKVLAAGRKAFVVTVGPDRAGGSPEAEREFDRLTVDGVTKVLKTPGDRAGTGCDCAGVTIASVTPVPLRAEPIAARPMRLDEMAQPDATDEWMIERFLRRGVLGIIGAPAGIGKSQIRTELGMLAAAGKGSFLDYYAVSGGPYTVLVIDEENGDAEEWRRDETHLERLGLERAGLPYYRLSFAGLDLAQAGWQTWLRERVTELGVDLLILDAISAMYSLPERREELTPVYRFLRELIVSTGVTVLLIHHLKKPAANERGAERVLDDLRGGLWGQVAEVAAILSPMPERRVKWRTWKRVPATELILEQTEDGPLIFTSHVDPPKAKSEDRILTFIDAGASSVDEIEDASGMRRSTIYKALSSLRAAGIVEKGTPLRRKP